MLGDLVRIIFAIFALYRLASLVSSDEGPYLPFLYKDPYQTGVFKWIRMRLGAYEYGPDGKPLTNLGRGISCPLCTAAYLAVPIIIFLQFPTVPTNLFLAWLGIWGVQTFLENLTSDEAIQGAIEDVADSFEDE